MPESARAFEVKSRSRNGLLVGLNQKQNRSGYPEVDEEHFGVDQVD